MRDLDAHEKTMAIAGMVVLSWVAVILLVYFFPKFILGCLAVAAFIWMVGRSQ